MKRQPLLTVLSPVPLCERRCSSSKLLRLFVLLWLYYIFTCY